MMTLSPIRVAGTSRVDRTAFVAGAIDGLVFLSYFFEVDQALFYTGTILLKVLLLSLRREGLSPASSSSFPFVYCLALAETASALANDVAVLSSVRIFVFCANLMITLNFVSTAYWRGIAITTIVNAGLYLSYIESGGITELFGRYLYFNNTHPNLGSEIFFGAAFALLLTRSPRASVFGAVLLFIPCYLMQGRAAELGILSVIAMLGWQQLRQLQPVARLVGVALVSVVGLSLLFTLDFSSLANKVLLLDNEYRGGATDASGRSLYWATALQMWSSHPLVGAGSDYPARLGVLQPHNFFLYPLAYYGILGLAPLAIFMHSFFRVALVRLGHLVPFIPMLAFNDRFVNLNTYPTVMFLYVFYEYSRIASAKQKIVSSQRLARSKV